MSSSYSTQQFGDGNDGSPYNIPVQPTSHFTLKNQKTASIIVTRSQGKFAPKAQGVFSYGDIMRIEIPSTQWLNTEEFAIAFTLNIQTLQGTPAVLTNALPFNPVAGTANSLHWIRVKNGVQSIFERVKLMAGSSIPLEDIQQYHILNLFMLYCSAPRTWVDNIGFQYEGVHSGWDFIQQCQMNCWNHTGGTGGYFAHEYYIRPNLGLFRTGKFLPMGYLGLITFEFYFNTPQVALIASARNSWTNNPSTAGEEGGNITASPVAYFMSDNPYNETVTNASPLGAGANYNISNVFAHCVWLNPREEINNKMMEKLKSGSGINLYFDTFRNSQRQVTNGWNGESTILIQERVASLKGVIMAMVNQYDDRSVVREIRFNHNNMTKYRWRIGDTYYPQTDVNCENGGVEAKVELHRFWGQDGNIEVDSLIKYENYRPDNQFFDLQKYRFIRNCPTRGVGVADRFIIGFNCENSIGQLSGIDTLRMNSDIEFRYTLNGGAGVSTATWQNYIPVIPEMSTLAFNVGITMAANATALRAAGLPASNYFTIPYFAGDLFNRLNTATGATPNLIRLFPNYQTNWADSNSTESAGTPTGWSRAPISMISALLPQTADGYGGLQICYPDIGADYSYSALNVAGTNAVDINSTAIVASREFATPNVAATTGQNAVFCQQTFVQNLYTPCVLPTYYTWQIFTHFDAVLQIKTFGTVAATTDIFQL